MIVAYVEAGLIKEDVVFLMVDLEQLTCLFSTLSRQTFDEILRFLRSIKMNS